MIILRRLDAFPTDMTVGDLLRAYDPLGLTVTLMVAAEEEERQAPAPAPPIEVVENRLAPSEPCELFTEGVDEECARCGFASFQHVGMPPAPEPGPCGDPECYVLHGDPANPIHPPDYVDSRTVQRCEHGIDRSKVYCPPCGPDPADPPQEAPPPAGEDVPTCGNPECELYPEPGKQYCSVKCRTRAATLRRKTEGSRAPKADTPKGTCKNCGTEFNQRVGGGRRREHCSDTCRRAWAAAKKQASGAPEPREAPAEDVDPPAPPAVQRACGRCDDPGHFTEDCSFKSRAAALKARADQPSTPVPVATTAAPPAPEPSLVERERSLQAQRAERKAERVFVQGLPRDVDDEQLGKTAMQHRERWHQGYPHSFSYLPDVLALYGVTEELVESCLRNPERVEVRPESFEKQKRYPVLGFFRGDVSVILGLRDPARPCVIAVYVGSLLEHDVHRVGHTGGGGSRKEGGVPTTPGKVASRLRSMGAEVAVDPRQETAVVAYKGQELGKISTAENTPRLTAQADFQRMQRKMHAIDRREGAPV